MSSQRRNDAFTDFWSEIAASKEHEQQQPQPEIAVIYRRRRVTNTDNDTQISLPNKENRLSLAPTKRISWNRSLSTRGRTSILISAGVDYQPQQRQKEAKKKPKQAALRPPTRKNVKPTSYEKERAYFEEVDSFELVEESPSPKNFGTWAMGVQPDHFVVPHFSSRLGKWLVSKKLDYSCGPSGSLCGISESPLVPMEAISDTSVTSNETIPERDPRKCCVDLPPVQNNPIPMDELCGKETCLGNSGIEGLTTADEGCEDIGEDFRRLSLTPQPASLNGDQHDPFETLLRICNQLSPSTLLDLFTQYWKQPEFLSTQECYHHFINAALVNGNSDPGNIVKLGEGTYGEVFKAGATVCKIVPIDGDITVTGEVQKRSEELLEEVMLSWTLNHLRGRDGVVDNACTTFIETLDIRICQGSYDAALIKAWEEYDLKRGSENAHPKEYPDKQCYVVFVLAHGGVDLESFVLSNFQEAQSLLVQVTAALAVAEAAYEFEHRDLHWGNILLTRTEDSTVQFILEGKQIWARTSGLSISIIDFTLSRINTGTAICFLDLSADPELFEGAKGDKQSQTYCKMKEVTDECWQGSFPKTNVLWLQYLIDILLLKKTFKRTTKNERELRSLKKSLNSYSSSREAIGDPFFSELLVDHAM